VHAEHALKILFWELHQNKNFLWLLLNPVASFQYDFKSLLFGYFLLVLKNSYIFSFLPHAQHA
jgi:hypothetical protein